MVDYNSMEYRLYSALHRCISYLPRAKPHEQALFDLVNDLLREWEESQPRLQRPTQEDGDDETYDDDED